MRSLDKIVVKKTSKEWQESMNKAQKTSYLSNILILSCFLISGCDRLRHKVLGASEQETPKVKLTVSAAASLKDVFAEIKSLHQKEYPETEVIYNFASSGSLQRQIDQGAAVDIFISAAEYNISNLAKKNLLLTATRQNLLHNQIVLIAPQRNQKNDIKLDSFKDLTTKEIKIIALGEANSVPVGKYAQEVLTFLEISDEVNSKAVYAKDARQVLNYVATGNVDAGIVYHTDALVSDRVKVIAIAPETSHSPVVYPIAVIRDSKHPEAAVELIEFLTTPEVQKIFIRYGFGTVNSPKGSASQIISNQ